MIPKSALPFALVLALAAGGCALAPRSSLRLDEAQAAQARMLADREVAALAPAEVRSAQEAYDRALEASNTLQDPALVDHLAYVARQRAAIAIEVAQRVAAERALGEQLRPASGAGVSKR